MFEKIRKKIRRYKIVIILIILIVVLFVDSTNVISSIFHFSVQGWATISSILTILITLYVVKIQKNNSDELLEKEKEKDEKRFLLESCLDDKLFRLFYANNRHLYAEKKQIEIEKPKIYAVGIEKYNIHDLTNFLSKIKVVSNSKYLSDSLKNKCNNLIEKHYDYFFEFYLDKEKGLFPYLELKINNKNWIIISDIYYEIWCFEKQEVSENFIFNKNKFPVLFNEYTVYETLSKYIEISQKNYLDISVKILNYYNNEEYSSNKSRARDKKESLVKLINDSCKGDIYFAVADFKNNFMQIGDKFIIYDEEMKIIIEDIVQELSY